MSLYFLLLPLLSFIFFWLTLQKHSGLRKKSEMNGLVGQWRSIWIMLWKEQLVSGLVLWSVNSTYEFVQWSSIHSYESAYEDKKCLRILSINEVSAYDSASLLILSVIWDTKGISSFFKSNAIIDIVKWNSYEMNEYCQEAPNTGKVTYSTVLPQEWDF